MKPLYSYDDFVRSCAEPKKRGLIKEILPVKNDGKVTYCYTFLDYRSGELFRCLETNLSKDVTPEDIDNPSRVRVKPLAVGDVVFDNDRHLVAVITALLRDGRAVLSQDTTLEHNQKYFDENAEEDGCEWIQDNLDQIYQFVPGRVDSREKMGICYEHSSTQVNYPYYSPYLDENLFYMETEPKDGAEDDKDTITLLDPALQKRLKDSAQIAAYLREKIIPNYSDDTNILLFLKGLVPRILIRFHGDVPNPEVLCTPEGENVFTVLARKIPGTTPYETARKMNVFPPEQLTAIHDALAPWGADVQEMLLLGDGLYYSSANGDERAYKQEAPKDFIPLAPAGSEETVNVRLTEERYPRAFNAKMEELIAQGFSKEDARRWLLSTPIVLELYYEKDSGLFAVESDALESCPEAIRSPYSGTPFKNTQETK